MILRSVLALLGRRSVAIAVPILLIGAFFAYGFVSMRPKFGNDAPMSRGDDWYMYNEFAINILDGGWSIPAQRAAYYIPGGFLYNYFVAGVYAVAGRTPAYVYVLQYALIALSAVLMYVLLRRYVTPEVALAYMFVSAVLTLLSFQYYVARLLSENLMIVLYPAVLLLVVSGVRKASMARLLGAGVFTGALILTRPNLTPLAAIVAILIAYSAVRNRVRSAAV